MTGDVLITLWCLLLSLELHRCDRPPFCMDSCIIVNDAHADNDIGDEEKIGLFLVGRFSLDGHLNFSGFMRIIKIHPIAIYVINQRAKNLAQSS